MKLNCYYFWLMQYAMTKVTLLALNSMALKLNPGINTFSNLRQTEMYFNFHWKYGRMLIIQMHGELQFYLFAFLYVDSFVILLFVHHHLSVWYFWNLIASKCAMNGSFASVSIHNQIIQNSIPSCKCTNFLFRFVLFLD